MSEESKRAPSLSNTSIRERSIAAAKADKTYKRPPRSTEAIYWIKRGVDATLVEVASDREQFVCPQGHRFWLDRSTGTCDIVACPMCERETMRSA